MKPRSWTDEQLIEAVRVSQTISNVLKQLGLVAAGGNYKSIRYHIRRLGINTDNIIGRSSGKGKRVGGRKSTPLVKLLVENSPVSNNQTLKRRLIKASLLQYACALCEITKWLNAPLTLHLDHVNGVNNDYRIENLRLLCPNCHSQTPTYCGRNRMTYLSKDALEMTRREIPKCLECEQPVSSLGRRCRSCSKLDRGTKTEWPSNEALVKAVSATSFSAVGRSLGVSDNAVRKRLRVRGLL